MQWLQEDLKHHQGQPASWADVVPGGDGATRVTLADSRWIYMANLLPVDTRIHLSLPTTPLCLLEAPAAKRQSYYLRSFPSIFHQQTKKELKSRAPWE